MFAGALLNFAAIGIALSGISVAQFWWSLVLLGVGWNFLYIGGTTLLTETYRPEEMAKAQGANEQVIFIVMAISSFTSGLTVTQAGWERVNLYRAAARRAGGDRHRLVRAGAAQGEDGSVRPPARIGQRLEEVDTPALVLELDAFERNLKTLADLARGRVRVRAHAKTQQVAPRWPSARWRSARSACAARRSPEAEAMVDGGIADVLVSQRGGRRGQARAPGGPRAAREDRRVRGRRRQRDGPGRRGARRRREARRLRGARSRHGPLRRRAGRARARARARGGGLRRACALPACRPTTAARSTCARTRTVARSSRRPPPQCARRARCWSRTASLAPSSPARAAAPSCSKWSPAPGTRSSPAPTPSWTPTTRRTSGRRRCRASSTRSSSSPP